MRGRAAAERCSRLHKALKSRLWVCSEEQPRCHVQDSSEDFRMLWIERLVEVYGDSELLTCAVAAADGWPLWGEEGFPIVHLAKWR